MADHLSTIGGIYEAFGRGDVAWILDQLDDNVAWDVGIRENTVPYMQPGHGKAHVANFFATLASTFAIDHFVIAAICEGPDIVLATADVGGQITGGSRIPVHTEVHEFCFGPDGKVVSFRHIGDLAVHERAAAGASAT